MNLIFFELLVVLPKKIQGIPKMLFLIGVIFSWNYFNQDESSLKGLRWEFIKDFKKKRKKKRFS